MEYFISRNDQVRGPFSKQQVLAAIKSKKLRKADLLGTSANGPWQTVEKAIGSKGTKASNPAPPVQSEVPNDLRITSTEEVTTYIRRGDSVNGPFSLAKIQQLLSSEKLKGRDLIRTGERGPWYEIAEVEESILSGNWPVGSQHATGDLDQFGYVEAEECSEEIAEELTPKQGKEIEKIVFAQDSYRASFPLELSQFFKPQEFILADTYGINEYYVLTTERLLICEISNKGLFFNKQTLGGPKSTVKLDRIVRLTDWSDLWWENDDVDNPGMMNLQIETLDGDYDLCVVWDSDKGYIQKDPLFFSTHLLEAYNRVEEDEPYREAVLFAEAKR